MINLWNLTKKTKMQNNKPQLNENLEIGDLKRLVHPELHIDQYKSKMGDDADVCVVSFKVSGKEPSADLVAFIEKGYDYVLDADVSSGEKEGGDYLVFVEFDRSSELPEQIMQIMEDLMNLTEQSIDDWRVRYHKSTKDLDLTIESLSQVIPLSPKAYSAKYKEEQDELDSLKTAAGVEVDTVAPKNDFTESLRIAAGLR
jgi:hypothetical protein